MKSLKQYIQESMGLTFTKDSYGKGKCTWKDFLTKFNKEDLIKKKRLRIYKGDYNPVSESDIEKLYKSTKEIQYKWRVMGWPPVNCKIDRPDGLTYFITDDKDKYFISALAKPLEPRPDSNEESNW